MREWVKALPLTIGLPVMIGAASVKPEDAASNLAAWAYLLGFEHVPAWLQNPATDKKVIIGSLVLGAAYAFFIWGVPAIRRFRNQPKPTAVASERQAPSQLEPDVDASSAFFEVLTYSEWSRRQTPGTDHPVADWLPRQLDREIHNRLRQGKLKAWGCYCLNPYKESPEAAIRSKKWAEIEIDFSPVARTSAIWRIKKIGFNVAYAGIRFCSEQIYWAFPLRDEIPLFEATVLAFEHTRNNEIAILVGGLSDSSEEGILTWYCNYMCRYRNGNAPLMTLRGSTPPSREKDEIYIEAYNGYHFAVEGKAIVLQQTQGKSRHENLSVRRVELKAAIATLSSIKVP